MMTERICSRPEILLNAVSYLESDPTGLIYNPNGHGPNGRYYSDYLNSLSTILEEQNSSCKICRVQVHPKNGPQPEWNIRGSIA